MRKQDSGKFGHSNISNKRNNRESNVKAAPEKIENEHELKKIKMPPVMLKRGRPKGADVTVIGLPKVKKLKSNKRGLIPFSKIKADEKNRIILECLVSPLVARQALDGKLITPENIETNIKMIPDLIRDNENVDVYRIERYFTEKAWMVVLRTLQKKENSKWLCPGCSKAIRKAENSVACERCLNWYHFPCVHLDCKPKVRNWFCRNCKAKHA